MLKISQKKNCNGCRALENTFCLLDYKMERVEKSRYFGLYEPRPLEPCPKPTKIDDFIYYQRNKELKK